MAQSLLIETPRLRLRPMRESDLEVLARINADPDAMRYIGNGKPLTRIETWRQIALFLGHSQIRGYSILGIEERSTGDLLGRCGPWYPEGWPMLEVGWLIDPMRQCQGFATEAGRAVVDWCFANLSIEKVCSLIQPDNAASIRVATKLGARVEDRLDDFFGQVAEVWIHRPKA